MKSFFRSLPIVSGKSGLCGQGCLGGGGLGEAQLSPPSSKKTVCRGALGALKIGQVLVNV